MARIEQRPDQAQSDVAIGSADEDMHTRILARLEKFAAVNFRKSWDIDPRGFQGGSGQAGDFRPFASIDQRLVHHP